jgi:phage shock protein B
VHNVTGLFAIAAIFIGLPWLIFHYVTQWKKGGTLTREDENLLDELYDLARRLDDRMCSIERIMSAENPNWRQVGCDPVDAALDHHLDDIGSVRGSASRRGSTAGRTRA